MTSAYVIQNIDGMMGSTEIERFEISDPVNTINADEIALWSGGRVARTENHRVYVVVVESNEKVSAAAEGDRVVKEFRTGGNLPTEVYALSAWAYDTILKRFF